MRISGTEIVAAEIKTLDESLIISDLEDILCLIDYPTERIFLYYPTIGLKCIVKASNINSRNLALNYKK